jgi:hypothetical protein
LLLADSVRLARLSDKAGRVSEEGGVRLAVVVAQEEGIQALLHLGQGEGALEVVEHALAQGAPESLHLPSGLWVQFGRAWTRAVPRRAQAVARALPE